MIECEKSTVSLINEDVLFIDVRTDEEFGLNDYKEVRLASLRLTNNRNIFNLINLGERTIPNKAAREACAIDTGSGRIRGEAFIVHSLGQRIVARHLIKEKKKHLPVKLFTSVEKAIKWIDGLRVDQ